MPTIIRLRYCVIYIYSREHNPPHFHVRTRDGDAAVEIDDLDSVEGVVDRKALKEARAWARENRDTLMQKWNEANGS